MAPSTKYPGSQLKHIKEFLHVSKSLLWLSKLLEKNSAFIYLPNVLY